MRDIAVERIPNKRRLGLAFRGLVLLSLVLASGIMAAPTAYAFANGQNASIVLGQPNLTTASRIAPIVNQSRLNTPYDVALDSSGNLWVADSANSRVLEFKPPFSNGESASIALGTSSLTSPGFLGGPPNGTVLNTPEAMAFDSSGNLWVSDTGDNRIVEFKAPFSTGENASLVLGVPNLSAESNNSNASATDLNAPVGLAFDSSGNLWVADSLNYRVVEFNAPFFNGEAASVVLGQDNFTAKDFPNEPNCPPACNTPTKATLNDPLDVAFDSLGNLWVADRNDYRVAEFIPPFSNGQAASLFVGGACAIFGVELGADCISVDEFIAFDHSGMLWVSDTSNGRILGFSSPLSSGENATVVLGQPDFVTGPSAGILNATQSDLSLPEGIAFDSLGNLWVSDSGSLNRVLEFPASASGSTSTASRTSQGSTTTAPISTTSLQRTTTAQLLTTSASVQSTSSPTTSSGGVPEFPFQAVAVTTVAVLVVATYVLVRRRAGTRLLTGRDSFA